MNNSQALLNFYDYNILIYNRKKDHILYFFIIYFNISGPTIAIKK